MLAPTGEMVIGAVVMNQEDGILLFSYTPDALDDLNNAKLVLAKMRELFGNAKVPIFVDSTNLRSMPTDARHLYASAEGVRNTKAVAILANTTMAKVIGNLFIGLNEPSYPTRLFTAKEEAIVWLKQHR